MCPSVHPTCTYDSWVLARRQGRCCVAVVGLQPTPTAQQNPAKLQTPKPHRQANPGESTLKALGLLVIPVATASWCRACLITPLSPCVDRLSSTACVLSAHNSNMQRVCRSWAHNNANNNQNNDTSLHIWTVDDLPLLASCHKGAVGVEGLSAYNKSSRSTATTKDAVAGQTPNPRENTDSTNSTTPLSVREAHHTARSHACMQVV